MKSNASLRTRCFLALMISGLLARAHAAAPDTTWSRHHLQAWCIVPFDSKERTPEQRAAMLQQLGFRSFAYDFRDKHIPTFDREVEVMKANGIAITAWWFPGNLDKNARTILATIERHGIHPDLWITGSGAPAKNPDEQAERVKKEAARLRPIAVEAARLGCRIGLYNHGSWFGDPENEVQVLQALRAEGITNAGLVYNFHHGHEHIRNFDKIWPRISRDVIAVNLSGLVPDGDRKGSKILYLGEGTEELAMMRVIRNSGWRGPIGILSHRTELDAAETLSRNLAGYDRLLAALDKPTADAPVAGQKAKAGGK